MKTEPSLLKSCPPHFHDYLIFFWSLLVIILVKWMTILWWPGIFFSKLKVLSFDMPVFPKLNLINSFDLKLEHSRMASGESGKATVTLTCLIQKLWSKMILWPYSNLEKFIFMNNICMDVWSCTSNYMKSEKVW